MFLACSFITIHQFSNNFTVGLYTGYFKFRTPITVSGNVCQISDCALALSDPPECYCYGSISAETVEEMESNEGLVFSCVLIFFSCYDDCTLFSPSIDGIVSTITRSFELDFRCSEKTSIWPQYGEFVILFCFFFFFIVSSPTYLYICFSPDINN